VVYLDLNHWYALGAASAGHPNHPGHVTVLHKLKDQVDQGNLLFPLSEVHYFELMENPREQYRQEAGDAMRLLSRFVTIAPLNKIVDEELAKELNRRFGSPTSPIRVPKFGVGVGFAFGAPGYLRLTGVPEEQIPAIEARLGRSTSQLEAEANATLEYSMLTTPAALRAHLASYDPYIFRREADRELASFNVLLNTLRTDPDVSKRPLDAICARQLAMEIRDNFTRALTDAGDAIAMADRLDSREVLTEFLMHLPSRRVASMIQLHYLRDINRDWTINDLRDIDALSTAVPHCDIVVTDKKAWDAATNRARLDQEFSTQIFRRLDDLVAHLEL